MMQLLFDGVPAGTGHTALASALPAEIGPPARSYAPWLSVRSDGG